MNLDEQRNIGYLIAKKLEGVLLPEEAVQLEAWANLSADNRLLLQELLKPEMLATELSLYESYQPESGLAKLSAAISQVMDTAIPNIAPASNINATVTDANAPDNNNSSKRIHHLSNTILFNRGLFGKIAVAVILFSFGFYWLTNINKGAASKMAEASNKAEVILPGKEGALLTLADGRVLVLDSMQNGQVDAQSGFTVVLNNGQLQYNLANNGGELLDVSGGNAFHTITTPKGRQIQLLLPDGTKVWLNAGSSMRYPPVFSEEERMVEITGEAYFEVAQQPQKPFLVKINEKAEVAVLGTSFNINAYADERFIKTTLVDGSIKVKRLKDGKSLRLQPGQQAVMDELIKNPAERFTVASADIDKALAWKNGLFNFESATLEEVMKQLERWYDIEVVYKDNLPDFHFVGEMSKDISLSDLIDALNTMHLNFKLVEGRKLIVSP